MKELSKADGRKSSQDLFSYDGNLDALPEENLNPDKEGEDVNRHPSSSEDEEARHEGCIDVLDSILIETGTSKDDTYEKKLIANEYDPGRNGAPDGTDGTGDGSGSRQVEVVEDVPVLGPRSRAGTTYEEMLAEQKKRMDEIKEIERRQKVLQENAK